MNVLHIGDYKVAGEKYSHNRMSKEKKESIKNIKDKVFEGREIGRASCRERV